MKDEVEEFLRRVAQMRAQAEQRAKAPQQQKPQRQPPKPPALVPRPPASPLEAMALQPQLVDAELADKSDRFGQRIRDDLRETEEISEHSRHLGDKFGAADTKMRDHMHEMFDHKLGHLKLSGGGEAAVVEEAVPDPQLVHLRQLLRSPQAIRDAMIMSEILRRPYF
jgi:hypothetical protein